MTPLLHTVQSQPDLCLWLQFLHSSAISENIPTEVESTSKYRIFMCSLKNLVQDLLLLYQIFPSLVWSLLYNFKLIHSKYSRKPFSRHRQDSSQARRPHTSRDDTAGSTKALNCRGKGRSKTRALYTWGGWGTVPSTHSHSVSTELKVRFRSQGTSME